tara:strand:- start:611 stop:976 length:366 start_codon:yes stop_codon:yes gene_type:complete
MRKYKNNIHLSKRETGILAEILREHIDNKSRNTDPDEICNLIFINTLERLFIKLNEKVCFNNGWMELNWEWIFQKRKTELIRNNRDKMLELNAKHIVKTDYEDIGHFNSYEKLKVELPQKT